MARYTLERPGLFGRSHVHGISGGFKEKSRKEEIEEELKAYVEKAQALKQCCICHEMYSSADNFIRRGCQIHTGHLIPNPTYYNRRSDDVSGYIWSCCLNARHHRGCKPSMHIADKDTIVRLEESGFRETVEVPVDIFREGFLPHTPSMLNEHEFEKVSGYIKDLRHYTVNIVKLSQYA